MKQNRNLLLISISIAAGIVVIWMVTSIQGGQRTYEVQPQITMPEYRTDAVRTLGAYERLMNRYMDMVDRNLSNIDRDIINTVEKIDSIEARLTELCERTARIEKALGIEQSRKPIKSLSGGKKTEIVNK
jgi:ATPase subunit of ABC transporter with duplicated ATPase domains